MSKPIAITNAKFLEFWKDFEAAKPNEQASVWERYRNQIESNLNYDNENDLALLPLITYLKDYFSASANFLDETALLSLLRDYCDLENDYIEGDARGKSKSTRTFTVPVEILGNLLCKLEDLHLQKLRELTGSASLFSLVINLLQRFDLVEGKSEEPRMQLGIIRIITLMRTQGLLAEFIPHAHAKMETNSKPSDRAALLEHNIAFILERQFAHDPGAEILNTLKAWASEGIHSFTLERILEEKLLEKIVIMSSGAKSREIVDKLITLYAQAVNPPTQGPQNAVPKIRVHLDEVLRKVFISLGDSKRRGEINDIIFEVIERNIKHADVLSSVLTGAGYQNVSAIIQILCETTADTHRPIFDNPHGEAGSSSTAAELREQHAANMSRAKQKMDQIQQEPTSLKDVYPKIDVYPHQPTTTPLPAAAASTMPALAPVEVKAAPIPTPASAKPSPLLSLTAYSPGAPSIVTTMSRASATNAALTPASAPMLVAAPAVQSTSQALAKPATAPIPYSVLSHGDALSPTASSLATAVAETASRAATSTRDSAPVIPVAVSAAAPSLAPAPAAKPVVAPAATVAPVSAPTPIDQAFSSNFVAGSTRYTNHGPLVPTEEQLEPFLDLLNIEKEGPIVSGISAELRAKLADEAREKLTRLKVEPIDSKITDPSEKRAAQEKAEQALQARKKELRESIAQLEKPQQTAQKTPGTSREFESSLIPSGMLRLYNTLLTNTSTSSFFGDSRPTVIFSDNASEVRGKKVKVK